MESTDDVLKEQISRLGDELSECKAKLRKNAKDLFRLRDLEGELTACKQQLVEKDTEITRLSSKDTEIARLSGIIEGMSAQSNNHHRSHHRRSRSPSGSESSSSSSSSDDKKRRKSKKKHKS